MSAQTVTLTQLEARTIQDVLRHISTSNTAVLEASFRLFHTLEARLQEPMRCTCHPNHD